MLKNNIYQTDLRDKYTGGMNILAIEDHYPDILVLKALLKEANLKYNFFHKEDLEEGIQLIKNQSIDIVLLDLNLKDKMGIGTLTEYLRKIHDVPVIVMTGASNKDKGERSILEGAQDYIFKGTWSSRELAKSLIFSLHRWQSKKKIKDEAASLRERVDHMGQYFHIAKLGKWSLDIVTSSMNWDQQMFLIFGQQPGAFQPTFSDYLNVVHVEDRQEVEAFFEKITKSPKQLEIKHRIVIDNTKIKEVLVRSGLYASELNVSVMGSVQDITEVESQQERFNNQLDIIHRNSLLQNLFSSFKFSFGANRMIEICKFYSDADKSQLKNHGDFVRSYANYTYQALLHLLLIQPNSLDFTKTQSYSQKDLLHNFEPFNSDCITGLKINLGPNFPDEISTNLELVLFILFSAKKLNKTTSLNNGDVQATLSVLNDANSNPELIMDIKGNFACHYLEDLISKNLEGLLKKVDNNKTFWHSFVYLQLLHIADGRTEKAVTQSNNKINPKIILPLSSPAKRKEEAPQKLNFLIVDDQYLNRLDLKTKLNNWNKNIIQIGEAENGKEALKKLKVEKFDLVFMDLHMPIMNGLDASARAKDLYDLPVIILYNQLSEEEEQACRQVQVEYLLKKPVNSEQLSKALQSVTSQSELIVIKD